MFTVRELREMSLMSQSEFSKATGIPIRTIGNWEQGRRTPPDWLVNLLEYFVTNELIKGAGA